MEKRDNAIFRSHQYEGKLSTISPLCLPTMWTAYVYNLESQQLMEKELIDHATQPWNTTTQHFALWDMVVAYTNPHESIASIRQIIEKVML